MLVSSQILKYTKVIMTTFSKPEKTNKPIHKSHCFTMANRRSNRMTQEIITNMQPSSYQRLGFHASYENRHRVIWEYIRRCNRSGTISVDTAQEGLVEMPLEFMVKLREVLAQHLPATNFSILTGMASFTGLVGSIYLLCKSMFAKDCMSIFASLSCLLSTIYFSAQAIKHAMKATPDMITAKVFELYRNILNTWGINQDPDQAQASSGTPLHPAASMTRSMVMVTTMVASMCGLNVLNGIRDMNTIVTGAKNMTDVVCDLLLDVFGIDLSGVAELKAAAIELEEKGQKFLGYATKDFNGQIFQDAKSWMTQTETLIRTVKNSNFNTNVLQGLHASVLKRVTEVQQLRSQCHRRPAPACLYLYGKRGRGKTEFVTSWLFPSLSQTFGLNEEQSQVYDLNSGKHFRQIAGERWAIFDEYGALRQANQTGMDPTTFNTILSGGNATIPGAAVETKHQTASFNGVVIMSNRKASDVDVGLDPKSKDAFCSRNLEFHVVDPRYVKKLGRYGQTHRDRNFNYLQFRHYAASQADLPAYIPPQFWDPGLKAANMRAGDVLKCMINQIKQNQDNFNALSTPVAPVTPAGFDLWQHDVAQEGTRVPVFWIAGGPGIGKTETYVPTIENLVQSMGMQICHGYETRKSTAPTCWILDDVVDTTTVVGQTKFADQYNSCQTSDMIIVISNFGPISRFPTYGRTSACRPISYLVPSFERRSGLQTPLHYEVTSTGIWNYDGRTTKVNLMKHIVRVHMQSDIEFVSVVSMPPIPWDVEIVSDNPTPGIDCMISALRGVIKYPALTAHAIRVLTQARGKPIMPTIRSLLQYVNLQYPTLKIRVACQIHQYAYADGKVYHMAGMSAGFAPVDADSVQIDAAGVHMTVHRNTYLNVVNRCLTTQDDTAEVLLLNDLRISDPVCWKKIETHFPMSLTDRIAFMGIYVRDKALQFWEKLKEQPLLQLVVVVIAFLMIWWFTNIGKPRQCACFGQDWGDICPFDEAQMAKGKNKGKRSNLKHFRSLKLGDKIIYKDDIEGELLLERIWQGVEHQAKAGNKTVTIDTGLVSYQGFYDESDMRWSLTVVDSAQAALFDHPIYEKIKKNTVVVTNAALTRMHAFLITPTIAVLPRHFCLTPNPWKIGDTDYTLREIYQDELREVLFCEVLYKGKPASYPNAQDMRKLIPSMNIVRGISTATVTTFRQGSLCMLTQKYHMEEKPTPFSTAALKHWGLNAGMVSWGEMPSFTAGGDCGMPIVGHFADEYFIIGVHAASRSQQQKYASVVLCSELIADVLANRRPRDEVHCGQSAVISVFEDKQIFLGGPYQFPEKFNDFMAEKKTGIAYEPSGAVTKLGYVKNFKPMDSKSKRKFFPVFPETVQGWKRKVPALTESEIFNDYQDRIPEDVRGLKHVHLIRTIVLESNYYRSCFQERAAQVARQLGEHYKIVLDITQLNPLSIDGALKGSYQALGVDMRTSAGVTMHFLTGSTMKQDMLGADGNLIPSVQALTEQQYELARQGMRLTLPADANLKSENLLERKEWKKRVFYNVPLPTVINLKRFVAPVQHAFQKLGMKSPFLFTCYPLRDWDTIHDHLMEKGGRWICLDVSGFDHSLNGVIITNTAEFLIPFFEKDEIKPRLRMCIRTFMEEIAFMPLIFGQTLVGKEGGLPSGIYGTSIVDDVSWHIMLLLIWLDLTPYTVQQFFDFVIVKLVGDDLIMAVDREVLDSFNAVTIASAASRLFGMKVTPAADKNGTLVPYVSVSDASFCSNTFVHMDGHEQMVIPKLKEESIASCLEYSKAEAPWERYEQYIAARHVVWPYGRAKFESFERELLKFAKQFHLPHTPMSYDAAREDIWRVVTSPEEISERRTERYLLEAERKQCTNMSQKIVKLRKQEFVSLAFAATNPEELALVSHDVTTFFKDLEYAKAIDWDDLMQWTRPITKEFYWAPKANTCASIGLILGIHPPRVTTVLKNWLGSLPSEETTERAKRYNSTRLAVLGTLFIHGESDIAAFDDITSAYAAARHFLVIPPPVPKPKNEMRRPYDDAQMNANLPETSAYGTGEGGVAMTGAAAGTQIDPLAAPQMTTTPAVATSSQELADSDNASVPAVLENMGGMDAMGLVNTNYATNVVSLCGKQIYVKKYNLSSSTTAGTIIDELEFNPWDPNLVSQPIALYGGLHEVFNGSIDIILNSYSAATIVGSIILAYVPPLLQKRFDPSLQNLKTVPSAVLNLKVGGSARVSLTGGSLTDCAVYRERFDDGSAAYGKFIVAAYTDIVNSYGVGVPIPIVMNCALGANAYFSHPSYLVGRSVNPSYNPGPMPPAVPNLILDSAIIYEPPEVVSTNFFFPGKGTDGYKLPLCTNGTASATYYTGSYAAGSTETSAVAYRGYFGSNPYGSSFDAIADSTRLNAGDHATGVCQNPGSTTDCKLNLQGSTGGIWKDYPIKQFSYNGLLGTYYPTGSTNLGTVSASSAFANPEGSAYVRPHGGEFNDKAVELSIIAPTAGNQVDFLNRSVACYAIELTPCNTAITQNFTASTTNLLTAKEADTYGEFNFTGAPVLAASNVTSTAAPTGFVQIYFDESSIIIPAVIPTVTLKRSMPYPKETNDFNQRAKTFFGTRPDIASYSYDVTTTTGETVCTVLVNRFGCFVYDATTSDSQYALLPNASTLQYINYQSYATEYPSIPAIVADKFLSRVTSASTYAYQTLLGKVAYRFGKADSSTIELQMDEMWKRILELQTSERTAAYRSPRLPYDNAEMFAAEAGLSAVGAIGGAFARKNQYAHETEMQKRQLKFWAGGQALDYKKATELGDLRAKTEISKANIQKDMQMAQYGYNADAQMHGNALNTSAGTTSTGTQTTSTSTASTQTGGRKTPKRQAPLPPGGGNTLSPLGNPKAPGPPTRGAFEPPPSTRMSSVGTNTAGPSTTTTTDTSVSLAGDSRAFGESDA
ncbi:hypothetical protein [Hubei picorna-like virus 65]|uniref:hypothetical protein n=1 Tax=Hubei picorna-like virus 65 TaxID=1923148 RepID=UPI00090B00B1|nr:hypothetical protein [Hubei picorna-like virus 65]APG78412.1 hypothetical protein [Hubei picorna-like virus 65]